MSDYSFGITIKKGLKYFVIFVLPFAVDQFVVSYPQWAQLTVGGLLVMFTNWLKNKVGTTLGGVL